MPKSPGSKNLINPNVNDYTKTEDSKSNTTLSYLDSSYYGSVSRLSKATGEAPRKLTKKVQGVVDRLTNSYTGSTKNVKHPTDDYNKPKKSISPQKAVLVSPVKQPKPLKKSPTKKTKSPTKTTPKPSEVASIASYGSPVKTKSISP